MAERIRDAVIGRYDVRGTPVSVGMSVGVATTERLVPVERLLAEADTAVYQAKRRPGRPVVVRGDLGESGPPDVDGG
jgi:GGDEF domain-containing protein